MDIITVNDLLLVPGLPSDQQALTYAASRASIAVSAAWCHPVEPVPEWVKMLAVDVAVRYLTNPRGVTSVTRTRAIDDASRSETERFETPGGVAAGTFELTEQERARLCPPNVSRRGVGSIRLAVPGYQS